MKSKRTLFSAATALVCLLGLALLSLALTTSIGGLSPLSELLAPSRGFWRHQSTERADVARRLEAALSAAGLQPVELEIDENEVPHLKAQDDRSLYFAQGFITAYYRLWQMDFLSRITAGRVSELLGEKALPIDRFFRRMRIPAAAKASADMMMADPVTRTPLAAYTAGVNARIGQIDITSVPIEYRLFGLLPEVWSDDRAAYLLKFMTWELTGYLYDFRMTASKAKLSQEIFELLFPLPLKTPGTILKSSTPQASQTLHRQGPKQIANHRWSDVPDEVQPEPANGSNNWAVPSSMMANRRALLANDLHLGYTLPSLWFSIQLTTPTMNVYGASLPGAPGVIVGFTESMGWAVTNGTDDVLDWYSLRYRDDRRQEYLFEDTWRPVVIRDEEIRVAGRASEFVKTRETHVGPIVFDEGDAGAVIDVPSGLAVEWTGFTPSNELRNFILLNQAQTARDCLTALKGYVAPAQNFVCADRAGRLVYKHAGLFPDRKGRDGRLILEASHRDDLWQGTLSEDKSPTLDTTNELIVTANQAPFSGEELKTFGWFFAAPYRALQIRSRIEAKKSWSPEQLIEVQADTASWLALNFKRIILREAAKSPLKEALDRPLCAPKNKPENKPEPKPPGSADTSLRSILKAWEGTHDPTGTTAALVHRWFKTLEEKTWTGLIGPQSLNYWPSSWRFYELLDGEPNSEIWDAGDTAGVETLNARLTESLNAACETLLEKFGTAQPAWSSYQATSMRHAGRIPGLGRKVEVGGVAEAIFANKGDHGPTWKMIVTFEDQPRAWTMIPGGQSGDPTSPQYDNLIETWARGEMRPVKFNMRSAK